MNKQSLYTVGGAALLASTALATTSANAAVSIKAYSGTLGTTTALTTFVPAPLATQVFSATTTTANSVTITGSSTTAGGIMIDVSPTFATFDLKIDIDTTTASFNNNVVPTVQFYQASTTGTLDTLLVSVTGCSIQPSTDRISILSCNPANNTITRVDAILVTGISYTSAAALRTAGTSITLSGSTFLAGTASTIDGITPQAVITSKSAVSDIKVTAGSTATIDNNASTPFAQFVSSGVTTSISAVLGCVTYSTAAAVGTDLAAAFGTIGSIISTAEVKITHSALTDSSLVSITFNGSAKVSSQFQTNTATFQVIGASLLGTGIVATFNGTSAITASSGTLSATVTPLSNGAGIVTAVPAFSGALASFSRGGLSVELNTVLPSAMKASYISFLRIANQSSVAGTATITVKNDTTGAAVGSFTTTSIPVGGTLSVNSVDIDAGLTAAGATVLTNASYKVTVTGAFNGYVQNLLFNVGNSSFADASGFRNGALTGDP